MKNSVYARFERMTINVVSVAPTLFRVSAYGIFDGDAENAARRLYDLGCLENGELESVISDVEEKEASKMKKQKEIIEHIPI